MSKIFIALDPENNETQVVYDALDQWLAKCKRDRAIEPNIKWPEMDEEIETVKRLLKKMNAAFAAHSRRELERKADRTFGRLRAGDEDPWQVFQAIQRGERSE